jgi:hypothetical protein
MGLNSIIRKNSVMVAAGVFCPPLFYPLCRTAFPARLAGHIDWTTGKFTGGENETGPGPVAIPAYTTGRTDCRVKIR